MQPVFRHHVITCPDCAMQITAIILNPSFPGWLAPMHFNPIRFEEFLSFAITVCGTWVGASLLVGGYKANATSGMLWATYRGSLQALQHCVALQSRQANLSKLSQGMFYLHVLW